MNKGSSKTWIVVIVALIVLGLLVFYFSRQQTPVGQQTDTLADEVTNLDLGNLDTEFQGIDADLNQL